MISHAGRLIMKRTILPLLLGLKFKVVTVAPFVFAILIILIKKALVISKAALLLSSTLGYNEHQYHPGYGGQGGFGSLAGHGGGPGYNHHAIDSLQDTLYKAQNKYREDVPFVSTRDFTWTERDRKKSLK